MHVVCMVFILILPIVSGGEYPFGKKNKEWL